jgi:hypothetical protein
VYERNSLTIDIGIPTLIAMLSQGGLFEVLVQTSDLSNTWCRLSCHLLRYRHPHSGIVFNRCAENYRNFATRIEE